MKRTNGRKIGTDTKLTPNQQLTQDQLQKSYDEGKGFVDNFVNNIFPHDKSVKNADMGKVVAELQNMGLVIKDQKPGGAFTLLDPDGGDGYLISPNSSIYENKLSLLNALGRKKLLIAKPKNTSDLPIFNN